FEAVADLDAHLALAWRHDQQHAVVLALLSDSPAAAELDAKILDRGALQRSQGHDHELVGGLGFEVRELLGERRPRRLIEDIGLVHRAAAERGQDQRNSREDGEQKESAEEQRQASARAWPIVPSPSLLKRHRGRIERGAKAGLRFARCAHGATIKTSPAAAWSRLRRP